MSNVKQKQAQKEQHDIALEQFKMGYMMIRSELMFIDLFSEARVLRDISGGYPKNGLALVMKDGVIRCNPEARAEPGEWARAIGHCLLHLGMEHFAPHESPIEWNIACDCVVEKFLNDLKFGKPWYFGAPPSGISDEERLYNRLCETVDKSEYLGFGTAGADAPDMVFAENQSGHTR